MSVVKAYAPATVANLNCGFDVLGMAIDQPGDIVWASFNSSKKVVKITGIEGGDGRLPTDATLNTAGVAVQALLNACKSSSSKGIDLYIQKQMPLGSGLGSSAASAVAAVVAANGLLGGVFTKNELLPFVIEAEGVASGTPHADNVAPSLLGGIVLVKSYNPLKIIQLPIPTNLYVVVVHPQVEILTKMARGVIPTQLPVSTTIAQMGNIAGFVAGLYQNNLELVGESMHDLIAEPHRSEILPNFKGVKNAALYGGALSFGISGSGPSMFALCDSKSKAENVALLMQKALALKNIDSHVYISKVNEKGAYVL